MVQKAHLQCFTEKVCVEEGGQRLGGPGSLALWEVPWPSTIPSKGPGLESKNKGLDESLFIKTEADLVLGRWGLPLYKPLGKGREPGAGMDEGRQQACQTQQPHDSCHLTQGRRKPGGACSPEARKRLVACWAPSQVSRASWWACSQHRTRGSCSSPP